MKNCRIISTFLGKEDHGIPTAYLKLDMDGLIRSWGMYDLRIHTDFIFRVLDTLEVSSWEKLLGTYCRVTDDFKSIAHIVKNKSWYTPEDKS